MSTISVVLLFSILNDSRDRWMKCVPAATSSPDRISTGDSKISIGSCLLPKKSNIFLGQHDVDWIDQVACFCSCTSVNARPRCGKLRVRFGLASEKEGRLVFPRPEALKEMGRELFLTIDLELYILHLTIFKSILNKTWPMKNPSYHIGFPHLRSWAHLHTMDCTRFPSFCAMEVIVLELLVIAKPVKTPSRFPYTETSGLTSTQVFFQNESGVIRHVLYFCFVLKDQSYNKSKDYHYWKDMLRDK